jgi:hypothetical protein
VAVYSCPACEVVLMQKVPPGTKVPCPRCKKDMQPKAGPGAPDVQFPQALSRESILDLEVPDAVRKAMETKRKKKQ